MIISSFPFYGKRNKKRRKFTSPSELVCGPEVFNFGWALLHQQSKRVERLKERKLQNARVKAAVIRVSKYARGSTCFKHVLPVQS